MAHRTNRWQPTRGITVIPVPIDQAQYRLRLAGIAKILYERSASSVHARKTYQSTESNDASTSQPDTHSDASDGVQKTNPSRRSGNHG